MTYLILCCGKCGNYSLREMNSSKYRFKCPYCNKSTKILLKNKEGLNCAVAVAKTITEAQEILKKLQEEMRK